MNSRIMTSKYKKLSAGSNMTGEVVTRGARSSLQCGLRLTLLIVLKWACVHAFLLSFLKILKKD